MFVCPECGAAQPAGGPCAADGAPLQPVTDDLLLGQAIGVYRVARLLGIGGMGRVYKGVHPQIGSRVAIKVLSRECADRRELVDRFFAEAKAVNVIRHESIVNVLDLATLPDGRPYIVMEYLDGAPLAWLIEQAQQARTPLPIGGVARLAAEVLDALGAAHAKGVVHRDLKPDNIFVTPAGRAKVLDFGIAKLRPELGGSATHTGSLLGTPHYMSPEQAAGRPVDHRADLYAMGVILFECVTLRKPFVADSLFELLKQHVEVPPPSPRSLRLDLPVDLEHVMFAALAKQPDQRFASAQAMSMALQHATAALPPEQWVAITPAAGRTSSGGWQPTPPASWAARERALQGQTTVSAGAGQLAKGAPPRKARSRRGVWMALGAIVLVGGGVAIGIAARGGGDTPAPAVASGPAPVPAAPPAAPATPPPVARPDPPPARDDSDKDDDDKGSPAPDADAAMLDGYVAALSPKQRAALPAAVRAALAKYGSFARMPAVERARLAGSMLAIVQDATAGIGDQVNQALAGGGTRPPAKPDALFDRHATRPPGFDAKHADIDAAIRFAYKEARASVADAALTRIDVEDVYPDGHADLSLPGFAYKYGQLVVRFTSPSHRARDPKVPRGVTVDRHCEFRVTLDPDGGELYETPGQCDEAPIPEPHCTMAALWKRALARHPDLDDAVASLSYYGNIVNHSVAWHFDVREGGKTIASETFADDCR